MGKRKESSLPHQLITMKIKPSTLLNRAAMLDAVPVLAAAGGRRGSCTSKV